MTTNILSPLIGFACILLSLNSLGAQTRFDFPDSRVDVSNFTHIESCVAAATRVQDSINVVNVADVDTLALATLDNSKPIPPAVLEVTKKCLTRFTPEQIPAPFAQVAQQAFLYAGRDADAAAVVRLRVEAIPDSTTRAFVLDSFARNYIEAFPRRVKEAHAIVEEVLKYGKQYPSLPRAGMCVVMMRAAVQMREDSVVRKYGTIALQSIQHATPEELDQPGVQTYLWMVIRELNQQVYKKELLDSLRVSTKAYIDFQTTKYNEFASRIKDGSNVGLQTVPLEGHYWFPTSAANERYPRKGKITILNFPSPDLEFYNKATHIITRRLGTRYPDADLVFSGSTVGYFGPGSEKDPKIEAQHQSRLFRDFRGNLHAVLGIAVNEITELPAPDGRRVHHPSANYTNYPRSADERNIFIIDEDGILVDMQFVQAMYPEIWLDELVRVLVERNKQRRN